MKIVKEPQIEDATIERKLNFEDKIKFKDKVHYKSGKIRILKTEVFIEDCEKNEEKL